MSKEKIHYAGRKWSTRTLCGRQVDSDSKNHVSQPKQIHMVTCKRCLEIAERNGLHISPAIKILELVWSSTNSEKNHSWDTLNHAMASTLHTIIAAGVTFYVNDFKIISETFRFGYWSGIDGHMSGESFYCTAVGNRNKSAAISFENWVGRKPFIFGERLTIGSDFKWCEEKVKVTSFSKDGVYLVACSYKDRSESKQCKKCGQTEYNYQTDKIKHQYKIEIADIRAETKWLKAVKEFPTPPEFCKAVAKIKIKNYQEFAAVDIEKELKGKRVAKATIESLVDAQAKLKAALPDHRKRGMKRVKKTERR